ncbi:MAG TPA: hypothetical protein VIU29_09010 [Candidatus Deferrimicrobiaceae bacterium]
MTRWCLTLLSALGLVVAASQSAAFTMNGRSSTQASFEPDDSGADSFRLAQYLRVDARDLRKGGAELVTGYARLSGDPQDGEGVHARLYHLYLDKPDIGKVAGIRLGRHYSYTRAGSALLDGLSLDIHPAGPVAMSVAGGRNILFSPTGEETKRGDFAGSFQVGLANIPQGSLDLSGFVAYDESELAKELVALSGSKRLFGNSEIYGQARLDLISEVWSELQAGVRTHAIEDLSLSADYFRSIPNFNATSIYAVFAVDRYQEIALKAVYEITPNLTANLSGRNEIYGEDGGANEGELGFRYRRSDGFMLYGAGVWRNGEGGRLLGFDLSADASVAEKYLLTAGFQHDIYKRDLMTGEETASRIWLGGESRIRRDISVSCRLEDGWNANFSHDLRARLALNVDF